MRGVKNNDIERDAAFYGRCAELLGVPDDYRRFPYSQRTRWNNRTPGNGRFAGRGLVRAFGSKVHVSLHQPRANRWFESRQAALDFLASTTDG